MGGLTLPRFIRFSGAPLNVPPALAAAAKAIPRGGSMRILSFFLMLFVSAVVAAGGEPPAAWQDYPVMFNKAPEGERNCRYFTNHDVKEAFTLQRLVQQLTREADGRAVEWVEPPEGAEYQLNAWRNRTLLKNQPGVIPISIRFATCVSKRGKTGAEIVSIYSPTQDLEISGYKVDRTLYAWFKRYYKADK